jgi:hypothetical protein
MGNRTTKISPTITNSLYRQMPDTDYWKSRPYTQATRGLRLHYPGFQVGAVSTTDFPAFLTNDDPNPTNRRLLVLYEMATGHTTKVVRA